MSDLFPDTFAELDAQIREVQRELDQRDVVYPRLIAAGKLRRPQADQRMAALQAVLATPKRLRDARGEPG